MPRMVLFLLVFFSSCIDNSNHSLNHEKLILPLESFSSIINNKKVTNGEDVNLQEDKSVLNRDYPIEIWLYANNIYFYELPNLGNGTGEWRFENGSLKLSNDHHIKTIDLKIKMSFDLYNSSNGELRVNFTDRFGTKDFPMEKSYSSQYWSNPF